MSRHKAEPKKAREMKMVRAWIPGEYGVYRYYMVYSDGEIRVSNRREADQYKEAYGVEPETIVGAPTGDEWTNSTGN